MVEIVYIGGFKNIAVRRITIVDTLISLSHDITYLKENVHINII